MSIDKNEVKTAGLRLLSILLVGIAVVSVVMYWPAIAIGILLGGCAVHFRQELNDKILKPAMKLFGWTNP